METVALCWIKLMCRKKSNGLVSMSYLSERFWPYDGYTHRTLRYNFSGPTVPNMSIFLGKLWVRSFILAFPSKQFLSASQLKTHTACHFTNKIHFASWNYVIKLQVDSSWNVMAHGDAREGEWRGNWRMEWVASTLHTTSEHGVSSITTADTHASAVSSRLNWRPPPI